jgi:adenosylmethionine-8-amino-7-oxononanoate aminotransferase
MGANVNDNSISITALEKYFLVQTENILKFNKNADELGQALYEKMPKEGLKHLFVLSEGSFVNAVLIKV